MVLCGHSFGGMTVLAASQDIPDVKNVITLDPWLGVLEKAIKEKKFKIDPKHKQNVLVVHTERFFAEQEIKFATN